MENPIIREDIERLENLVNNFSGYIKRLDEIDLYGYYSLKELLDLNSELTPSFEAAERSLNYDLEYLDDKVKKANKLNEKIGKKLNRASKVVSKCFRRDYIKFNFCKDENILRFRKKLKEWVDIYSKLKGFTNFNDEFINDYLSFTRELNKLRGRLDELKRKDIEKSGEDIKIDIENIIDEFKGLSKRFRSGYLLIHRPFECKSEIIEAEQFIQGLNGMSRFNYKDEYVSKADDGANLILTKIVDYPIESTYFAMRDTLAGKNGGDWINRLKKISEMTNSIDYAKNKDGLNFVRGLHREIIDRSKSGYLAYKLDSFRGCREAFNNAIKNLENYIKNSELALAS